ncbi:unnamed protein product [Umbelopsis ramanniana]
MFRMVKVKVMNMTCLRYIISHRVAHQKTAVDNFVLELLRIMKFTSSRRNAMVNNRLSLNMCHATTIAAIHVCILNDEDVLLLVEENKAYRSALNPDPKLIAEAIAEFQSYSQKGGSRNP